MLRLRASVREGLLDGHQQLVPQRFIDKSAIKTSAQTGEPSSYSVHIAERRYRTKVSIMTTSFREEFPLPVCFSQQLFIYLFSNIFY